VLLITGATGTIGRSVLRRLLASGTAVRCFVRDPGRLGARAGAVQIAVGDLADPASWPAALDGVDTVIHLAAPIRDRPRGAIEALAGRATCGLVDAAVRAGVSRFVFFSVLGACADNAVALLRAKGAAERCVVDSPLTHTIFALGWVYGLDDPFVTLSRRMSVLPVMPIAGTGSARFQPIWADDVADCVIAALGDGPAGREAENARFELAGPETLSYEQIVGRVLAASGRRRAIVRLPGGLVRPGLRLLERIAGDRAFATWDEVRLLELTLLSARGTADAERLGVHPKPMAAALSSQRQDDA
jgi:uncharacterized protein YbjT (DUF2867 family)